MNMPGAQPNGLHTGNMSLLTFPDSLAEGEMYDPKNMRLAVKSPSFLSSSSLVFSDRWWYGAASGRASRAGHLETATLRGGGLKGSPPGWRRVCRMFRPLVWRANRLDEEPNAVPRTSGWMTRCSGRRTHS